tara:strand:- start:1695 stop:2186 length:492 start_codon:yes stop_codon:yes gene_type:complete
MRKYLKIPGRRFVLTKKMVEDSIENTKSNAEASRWLGVSFNTYKKYAKMYGLFEQHKNQSGKGVKKTHIHSKYDLDDILSGKYENYSKKMLKRRLIDNGYITEECGVCGWNEKRLTDDRICLTLDFIDGDESNFSIENLRLLCPNCYFTNVGNFKNSQIFCTK